MLVIISDLHLTDGTSGQTISAGAFRILRERLSDLAYDASWRSDGAYKPIEVIDLILLGDILDAIRSTKWLADEAGQPSLVRPWDDPHSQPFIDKVRTITQAILAHNDASLAEFRKLSDGQSVTIPPATAAGLPARVSREPTDPARVPVQVRIHYIVGNHDWFYHLPGPAYDEIRQDIIKAINLANPAGQPFPHDPAESAEIEALFQAHQVFARHGDIYDPANFEGDRDRSSLGDAVVVELLNRFPATVEQMMGPDLPQATRAGLKEVDNVRPVLAVPIWVNGLLRRTLQDQGRADRIKGIWDDLADEFLHVPFVRARDKALDFFDNVDKLEWALKFSKGVSLQFISQVVTWLNEKLTGGEVTYHRNAFEEVAFRRKMARYIVHGHTHQREIVPLDFTFVGGKPFEQIYFNSGTWRRVHAMARFDPQQQEFLGYYEMTYFAFYKDDERKGRPFEMWGGALGG